MNNLKIKPIPDAFANGFGYFCTGCGHFFSVQIENDCIGEAGFCPYCGTEEPITTIAALLAHCDSESVDPINFYTAFPVNEPIPQSETGATPFQVETIVAIVTADKQSKHSVEINTIAYTTDIPREIVAKVFDELHITESSNLYKEAS